MLPIPIINLRTVFAWEERVFIDEMMHKRNAKRHHQHENCTGTVILHPLAPSPLSPRPCDTPWGLGELSPATFSGLECWQPSLQQVSPFQWPLLSRFSSSYDCQKRWHAEHGHMFFHMVILCMFCCGPGCLGIPGGWQAREPSPLASLAMFPRGCGGTVACRRGNRKGGRRHSDGTVPGGWVGGAPAHGGGGGG